MTRHSCCKTQILSGPSGLPGPMGLRGATGATGAQGNAGEAGRVAPPIVLDTTGGSITTGLSDGVLGETKIFTLLSKNGYPAQIITSRGVLELNSTNSTKEIFFGEYGWQVLNFTNNNSLYPNAGVATLTSSGPTTQQMGFSAAINAFGNTIALGAPFYIPPGDDNPIGGVYIFNLVANKWTQTGFLQQNESPSNQGYAVALNAQGNYLVVGDPGYNNSIGRILIYRLVANIWTLVNSIQPLTFQGQPGFGTSVSVDASGDIIVVGGPNDAELGGAVWYIQNELNQIKLLSSGHIGNPSFGTSVDLNAEGNILIVGGPSDNNNQGAAWVYPKNLVGTLDINNAIKLSASLALSSTVPSKQGTSVAINANGDTVALGAPNYSSNTNLLGAVAIYMYVNSSWILQQIIKQTENIMQDVKFGTSIDLSSDGNVLAVGGPELSTSWIFERVNSWNQIKVFSEAADNLQGFSVVLNSNGNTLVSGAPAFNIAQGAAFVYS